MIIKHLYTSLCALLLVSVSLAQVLRPFEARGYLPHDLDSSTRTLPIDIDADGDLDLMVLKRGVYRSQTVELLQNDGTGKFKDVTSTHLPSLNYHLWKAEAVDLDGDGDIDLVASGWHSVVLLVNTGAGVFRDETQLRLPLPQTSTVSSTAVLELNGDSRPDLVVILDQRVVALQNNGTGTFIDVTATSLVSTPSAKATSVNAGDLDGDGDDELLWASSMNPRSVWVLVNDGAGHLTSLSSPSFDLMGYTGISLGDIDGDGDLDVLEPEGLRLLVHSSGFVFRDESTARLPVQKSSYYRTATMVDIDADTDLDILTGYPGEIFLNDGSGHYANQTAQLMPLDFAAGDTCGLTVADLDGDLHLDVITANETGCDRLYLGKRNGGFLLTDTGLLPQGVGRSMIYTLADIDGDGDQDILDATVESALRVRVNDGMNRHLVATSVPRQGVFSNPSMFLAQDFDGDGDVDVLAWGATPCYFEQTGPGIRFTDRTKAVGLDLITGTEKATAFDADGDGFVDLVGWDYATAVGLIGFDGLRFHRRPGVIPGIKPEPIVLRVADIDADGDLDVVVATIARGILCFRNDSAGVFRTETVFSLSTYVRGFCFCDADGDSDLDLVIANSYQENRLLLNDGKGKFQDVTWTHMPWDLDPSAGVCAGDIDEDGDVDLVFTNAYDQRGFPRRRFYLNDGTGRFSIAVSPTAEDTKEYSTINPRLIDLDGDGDLDLLFDRTYQWAFWDGEAFTFTNELRQLRAPQIPRTGREHRLDISAHRGRLSPPVLALPFVSTSQATTPIQTPLGRVALAPGSIVALASISFRGSETASLRYRVPVDPSLTGRTFYFQAIVQRASRSARLTNAIAVTVR